MRTEKGLPKLDRKNRDENVEADDGNKKDWEDQQRAKAGVANISDKIREARTCGQKDIGRCCNENTEDGSDWPPNYRKTKTEGEDMKEKRLRREEAQDRRTWRMKTQCSDPKYRKGQRRRQRVQISHNM